MITDYYTKALQDIKCYYDKLHILDDATDDVRDYTSYTRDHRGDLPLYKTFNGCMAGSGWLGSWVAG